jgi:hypothetical protein
VYSPIVCLLTFGIFRRELVYKELPQNSPHIYFFRVVITFQLSFCVFFEYAENNSNSQQFTTTWDSVPLNQNPYSSQKRKKHLTLLSLSENKVVEPVFKTSYCGSGSGLQFSIQIQNFGAIVHWFAIKSPKFSLNVVYGSKNKLFRIQKTSCYVRSAVRICMFGGSQRIIARKGL